METSKRLIKMEEWMRKINSTRIMKEDMNKLVMNLLVTNGYQEAAQKFQKESATKLEVDLRSLNNQATINKYVQYGDIEYVIERLNSLNPEILNANPELFFRLLQQIMVELILAVKEEAFEFAYETLFPIVQENEDFMQELKYTLTLLTYEDISTCSPEELRNIKYRFKIASEVNAAMLELTSFVDQATAAKNDLQYGNIEDAIERLNRLKPEILNANLKLFFRLNQQILFELLISGKEEALLFANEKLLPFVVEHEEFRQEFRHTVSLIASEDVSTCPSKELREITQRFKIAREVNAAILTSQGREKDTILERLLKMLVWSQNQLDEIAVYPRINNLSTAKIEEPSS